MKKILMKGAVAVAILSFLSSCNSDNFENKFEDGPTQRTEKRINELKDLLQSSPDGWKMTYFTDDKILGGFTYIFKFNGNQVEMISDVNGYNGFSWSQNPLVGRTTSYAVTAQGNTVNLLFDEASYIHLICDNSIYPNNTLAGKGFKGDFQYYYYGADESGINFLTPRESIALKFEKASTDDWTNLASNRSLMTAVASKRSLVVIDNNESSVYNFRYTASTRYASVLNAAQTESVNGNGGIGIGFNMDEIIVSPAIEFEDGSTISVLKMDGGVFKGESGSNSVTIM